jgi:integrase
VRKQKGQLIETKKAWFIRYYTTEIAAGQEIRKQTCVRLCEKSDLYRHESDVRPLMDQHINAVNAKQEPVTGSMLLGEYVTRIYLPWVKSNLTAATHNGYRQLWNRYLSPRFDKTPMIDLQTHEVTALLTHYAQSLGARTLSHIKWLLSGVYVFAIGQGTVPKGSNPAFDAKWQAKPKRPRQKLEYSVKQIIQMIDVLKPVDFQAACAVAVCYFTSARPAECRGLRWEDWTGDKLEIKRGMWRNHVGDTKTESSVRTQKVKKTLHDLLTELREKSGNPSQGYIFQNRANKPLSLDSLSGRVIAPTLKKAGIAWAGYYPCRRGISSLMTGVSKNPLNSTGLLGHSNPATALEYYTTPQADSIDAAQDQVEELAQIELRSLEQEKVSQSSAIN